MMMFLPGPISWDFGWKSRTDGFCALRPSGAVDESAHWEAASAAYTVAQWVR